MMPIATLTSPYGAVTVHADRVSSGTGERTREYVVTGEGGYRAVLPGCPCSDSIPCPLPYGHAATRADRAPGCVGYAGGRGMGRMLYCHGWHDGSVVRFARDVLATYAPPARPRRPAQVPPRMRVTDVAAALGMTVEQYRAEVAKAWR